MVDQLRRAFRVLAVALFVLATVGALQAPAVVTGRATSAVPFDPDDPAIWINRRNPERSLVLGTIKAPAPDGGLAVFGLDGALRTILRGADRPNNVDVEYGLTLGGKPVDIAVLTERLGRRLRAYAISPDGESITDVSGPSLAPILTGIGGDAGAPMGIGLYRRPRDGAVFAIIAPKAGATTNYLAEYRLADDGSGRVGARLVRRFGTFSGGKEIEAVAVDDALGFVYYADETFGIHKWYADPDHPSAGRELALFGTKGYIGDREGLGVYANADGTGYLVSVDQRPGQSVFHVYLRQGERGNPHDHSREVATFVAGADSTDGLDVVSAPLGPNWPQGLLAAMNSAPRNFLLIDWRDVTRVIAARIPDTPGPK